MTNEISGLPVDEAASGSFIERANNHRSPADSAIEVTSSKEGSQHDVADAYSVGVLVLVVYNCVDTIKFVHFIDTSFTIRYLSRSLINL